MLRIKHFIFIIFFIFILIFIKNNIFAENINNYDLSEIILDVDNVFIGDDNLFHIFIKGNNFDDKNQVFGFEFNLNFNSDEFKLIDIKLGENFGKKISNNLDKKIFSGENYFFNGEKIFFILLKNFSTSEKNFLEFENNEKFLEVIFSKKNNINNLNNPNLNNLILENIIFGNINGNNINIRENLFVNNNSDNNYIEQIISSAGGGSGYRWFKDIFNNDDLKKEGEKNEEKEIKNIKINKNYLNNKINFSDLKNHWAKKYAEKLSEKNFFNNEKFFKPEIFLTKFEVLKILINGKYGVNGINFKNNNLKKYSNSEYLKKAFELGIIDFTNSQNSQIGNNLNNLNNFKFKNLKLGSFINRAEALKMVFKGFKINNFGNPNKKIFSDIKKGIWFEKYVNFAYEKGIISGYGNGKFGAENFIKKGEIAKIIFNTLEYNKKQNKK